MNTKLLMTVNAILLAAIGICLSFATEEIMAMLNINATVIIRFTLQLLGAAYYAFAVLNWMAKGAIIGGIYNRPIAMANFTNFLIGGIVFTKAALTDLRLPATVSILGWSYLLMACLFGFIISRHPGKTTA